VTIALNSDEYVSEKHRSIEKESEREKEEEQRFTRQSADARRRMFSGLTNQVSTWMGKKPENGSELTSEQKATSPEGEGSADLERKDSTRYAER